MSITPKEKERKTDRKSSPTCSTSRNEKVSQDNRHSFNRLGIVFVFFDNEIRLLPEMSDRWTQSEPTEWLIEGFGAEA